MCGIIGVIGTDKQAVRSATKALLFESQIRGKHATGISYMEGSKLVTVKEPIPAKEFVLPKDIGDKVIAHVRYSTSDLEYNQPLTEDNYSLVHNGVITQAPFEQWEKLYGFTDYKTRNDSEILLKAFKEDMFINLPNASIAAGILVNDELLCFRNGQRPLYIFGTSNICGFASTENIISRALGKDVVAYKAKPNLIYNMRIKEGKLDLNTIDNDKTVKDLQFNTIRGWRYLKGASISC
jgi:glutamine phosphoribosylpyrophosphate amidotransferase